MALPRFIVLKSKLNDKYLHYMKEDGPQHGYLQFSGEGAVSPLAKFELEMSKYEKGMYHIRCCYSNKYWAKASLIDDWITAEAWEPEEDRTRWRCTLFEPMFVNAADAASGEFLAKTVNLHATTLLDKTIRFWHVQLGQYAFSWRSSPPSYDSCLSIGLSTPDVQNFSDVCTIIDWESLVIFPKHVAFIGDNGNYMNHINVDINAKGGVVNCINMTFTSNDVGDPAVQNQVFSTPNGSICIRSFNGRAWKVNNTFISLDVPHADGPWSDVHTWFWPIKIDDNVVALRAVSDGKFCSRICLTARNGVHEEYLLSRSSIISKETRLEVKELVLSRSIYNVNFRLSDDRIYSKSIVPMATGDVINRTNEISNVDVKLSYTTTRESTWTDSVSLKLGTRSNIQTGVPRVDDGFVHVSDEFIGDYIWGETKVSTTATETVCKVAVPPMTMVKVHLLATKASCDVPFSYSRRDTLYDGRQITYNMDDSVYTGTNCFNFKYEIKEQPLP